MKYFLGGVLETKDTSDSAGIVAIKFSHRYPKLRGQDSAVLLAVGKLSIPEDLNEELREYDTRYETRDTLEGYGYYPLPKGKYLHLVFVGNKGVPFCTIRSDNPQKEAFYKNLVGKVIKISVTEDGDRAKAQT
jgi:hypothetical protein